MKLERTKNSIKGITSGVINKFILILIPFIVRSIFIHTLGVEYSGLNSLFRSILDILNLAELGIGSAIIFNLYNSIAKNDENEICALMNFYKKIYNIIGIIILGIGLIILPFIKFMIKSDIPGGINIYIIYVMFLVNSALSYFIYAYKSSLLRAHQQIHIINNIDTIVKIILNILQAVFLLLGQGYYLYLVLTIIATIVENVIIAIWTTKKYSNYKPKGKIPKEKEKEIYKKVKAIFLYKIGGIVLTSVDSVVISAFLGLTILGKYDYYYYVITALFGFFQVFVNSISAGIGNSIASESIEKNKNDFDKLNFLLGWVVSWCSVCLLCLYQPFIKGWVGEENMFPFQVVLCLSIYFYVWKIMEVVNVYKEAAGLWEYDKYRPIVASIFNLVINIVLVQFIGIYGIILSTIISIVFIIFPWSTYILFREYFKNGYKNYLKDYFYNLIVTIIACFLTYSICSFIKLESTILTLVIYGLICIIVPNIIFITLFSNTRIFKDSILWLMEKLKLKRILEKLKKYEKILKIVNILLVFFVVLSIIILMINKYCVPKAMANTNYLKIHFSIDDTILIFDDLNKNKENYESIFENNTLRYLKELNKKYGCKFSLFCFYEFRWKINQKLHYKIQK